MKFDLASIVDKEFSKLVWTGSERVNHLMDTHERKMLFWKRNRYCLAVSLSILLACLMIALAYVCKS